MCLPLDCRGVSEYAGLEATLDEHESVDKALFVFLRQQTLKSDYEVWETFCKRNFADWVELPITDWNVTEKLWETFLHFSHCMLCIVAHGAPLGEFIANIASEIRPRGLQLERWRSFWSNFEGVKWVSTPKIVISAIRSRRGITAASHRLSHQFFAGRYWRVITWPHSQFPCRCPLQVLAGMSSPVGSD